MSLVVNLQADLGEAVNADEAALLKIVKSANIACGFHAGDPTVMHRTVAICAEQGVSIGAHPGFQDPENFGRNPIEMALDELEYMVAYQIGALQAIAAYEGLSVTHVKPHGALYNMAAGREDYAQAIGRAIKALDPALIYLGSPNSEMQRAAEGLGLRYLCEGFADRQYDDDGHLVSRKIEGSVIKDPALAVKRAVHMVIDGEVTARSGKVIQMTAHSLCVHGDEPGALAMAAAVSEGLEAAGITIATIPDMVAS